MAKERPQDGQHMMYANTVNPDLRAGMERFLSAVTTEDVEEVLAGVYEKLPDSPYDKPSLYERGVFSMLDVMLNERFDELDASSTVDVAGVVGDLSMMNHPDVWTGLLQKIQGRKDIEAGLGKALPEIAPRSDLSGWGRKISEINKVLFGRALMYTGIAAVYGSEFPDLLGTAERIVMRVNMPQTVARYHFGVALGEHFGSPAASPEQVFERLQTLFPENAPNSGSVPAWRLVSDSGAFQDPNKGTLSGFVVCAGQEMTGKLFRGFGNLLARPEIQ